MPKHIDVINHFGTNPVLIRFYKTDWNYSQLPMLAFN